MTGATADGAAGTGKDDTIGWGRGVAAGRNGTVCTGDAGCVGAAGKAGCGAGSTNASITVGGTGGVEMDGGKACICVASHSKPRCAASTSSAGRAPRSVDARGTVR